MRPLVIGHRGFAGSYPENTVAAVAGAVAIGSDGVEVDVRPCADGTWMCHHNRTRDGVAIASVGSGALRRDGVPTVAEILVALPSWFHLFIEVKPLAVGRWQRLGPALLGELGAWGGRVRMISSSLTLLRQLGAMAAGVPLSWVLGRMPRGVPSDLDLSPRHTLVERLGVAGRPLHPWTVNDAARAVRLWELGVASITTDRPDVVLEALDG